MPKSFVYLSLGYRNVSWKLKSFSGGIYIKICVQNMCIHFWKRVSKLVYLYDELMCTSVHEWGEKDVLWKD